MCIHTLIGVWSLQVQVAADWALPGRRDSQSVLLAAAQHATRHPGLEAPPVQHLLHCVCLPPSAHLRSCIKLHRPHNLHHQPGDSDLSSSSHLLLIHDYSLALHLPDPQNSSLVVWQEAVQAPQTGEHVFLIRQRSSLASPGHSCEDRWPST